MAPNMKRIKPLHVTPRKEKIREENFMTENTKVEDQALLWNKRRRRIFHTFSPSNVISTDTMPDNVMIQRKGNIKPQLLMLIKTPLTRSKGTMIIHNSSSSSLSQVQFLPLAILG